jgi:hypothetical protein
LAASRPSTRSESRTDETSGLVTTIASSAKYIAICAPFSMPAGESQMMYSKPISLSSSMHAADALGGERVLVARLRRGQTYRLSTRLSRISVCCSFASLRITLTKS